MLLLLLGSATAPKDTSVHRHKDSRGVYVTVTDGAHRHADIEARLKALETYMRTHP